MNQLRLEFAARYDQGQNFILFVRRSQETAQPAMKNCKYNYRKSQRTCLSKGYIQEPTCAKDHTNQHS